MTAYRTVHGRVRRAKGKPGDYPCIDGCGSVATDWSYVGRCPDEQYRSGHSRGARSPFCEHVDHYVPRCHGCNLRYDARERARG